MALSALLLTLGDDPLRIRARLAHLPCLEVGDLHGSRLPVVLESESAAAAASAIEHLAADPDIVHLDLVTAFYGEEPPHGPT